MRARFLYITALVTAGLFLFSCQSVVRFSGSIENTRKAANQIVTKDKHADKLSKDKIIPKKIPDSPIVLADNSSLFNGSLIGEAEKWLGVPYKWGGRDSAGTDCSGFVQSVYKAFGYNIPRTASEQYESSELIGEEEARPGDLIFFKIDERIVHVGLYAGNNKMIHASTKSGVIVQELNKYFYYSKKENIAGYGRIIPN